MTYEKKLKESTEAELVDHWLKFNVPTEDFIKKIVKMEKQAGNEIKVQGKEAKQYKKIMRLDAKQF